MYDSDESKMAGRRKAQRARPRERLPRLEPKAPIKSAVLALLLEEPGLHGYEIWKRVNRRMGWNLIPKHIYEPLKQLEKAGLVRRYKEPISEPPGYRVLYMPTEVAKEVRDVWFKSPTAMSVLRADLHVRLAFSTEEDAPELLRTFSEAREELLDAVEEEKKMSWAAPRGSWVEFSLGWLRERQEKQRQAEIEWINEVSEDIEDTIKKRQKP